MQAIVGQYRGTHLPIVKNIKTSQCTRYRYPICDTYLTWCAVDVSREFKFHLDVDISTVPTLKDDYHSILSQ